MEVRRAVAIAALVFLVPGCFAFTTKSEGKKLKTQVTSIDDRLKANESSLQSKLAELEEVLGKATKLLQRNSANLGADVKALSEDNAALTGMVAEAKRMVGDLRGELAGFEERMNALDSRLKSLEDKANQPPPKSAADTYSDAKAALKAGKYQDARVGFSTFVRKWPGHELADEAMYYWGEGHFKDGNYEKAIAVFQKTFEEYKDSQWADDAMFRAAEASEKLKWCTDALAYYSVLQQRHPKSSLKKKAAARVKAIKKVRKKKSKCQS
jgi:tol-pal system protein YbgF